MKRYAIIALLLPLLAGCDSFLGQVPDDRTELMDVESVKALLVSAYPDGHYMMQGELMSDNAGDKGSWMASIMPEMQEEAYFWQESTQNIQDAPIHYWGRIYKAVSAANHALEAIENNGAGEEYTPYAAEARMARAFSHFLLVNMWGKHYDPATAATDPGVPYVTKPEKEALVDYTRNTVAECYDLIERDMIEAMPLLSDNAYDVPKYHFNRAAANVFMSRFYLYRGEEGDWDKVIEHTSAVLLGDFRSQLRDYAGKYSPIASDMDEYAMLYTSFGEPSILMLTNAPSFWYYSSYAGRYGMTESKMLDILRAAQVSRAGDNPVDLGWIGWSYGTYPYYTLSKFYDYLRVAYPGASSGTPYVLCPIITMEEAALNRAEAYIMKKQYDLALNDLNIYLATRTRNYQPGIHTVTKEEVVTYYTDMVPQSESVELRPWYVDRMDHEQMCMLRFVTELRRKEFLQEGMRWFDVKRFHIEVTHGTLDQPQVDVLGPDDPRRVLQIPPAAVEYGLEPNPR